tara:strand:- start:358 stop:483 length:126 start_codon:yes stop_codon:yes gene_type:complete
MDETIKEMIEILELEDYDLILKRYYESFDLIDALEIIKYLS